MSIRPALTVLAIMVVAACSDSPTAPSSNTPDIAALLAEMSPASVSAASSLAGGDLTVSGSVFLDPGHCTYSASTGWFGCPTVTTNGLTFTGMYRLIDASGNPQPNPDGQTSAIETKTSISGQVTSTFGGNPPATGTYSINSISDQTLSNLRATNHVLNGVSTTTINGSIQFATTTIPIDDTQKTTISSLILPNASKGQQWPLSGTITVDEMPNSATEFLIRTVITFNGTSVVTLTMTTAFGTTTCHFDLASSSGTTGCVP